MPDKTVDGFKFVLTTLCLVAIFKAIMLGWIKPLGNAIIKPSMFDFLSKGNIKLN